jgi:hypothetical protein
MARMTQSVVATVITLAGVALGIAPSASAAAPTVPQTLTEQGRLLDNTNTPVDGVALSFSFSLYTTATAGTAIWTEKQTITPDQGYFSAMLGEVAPFPATIFDGSQPALYLGITIGTDTEMAPRQAVTSVPFALLSLNATHASTADSATNATNATNATTAVGALNTRIAALEAQLACPGDTTAPTKYGFCIWHEDGGATYTHTYTQAAALCASKGARLCTLAEVSAAQAAGDTWCAYSWVADRASNTTGYETLPLQVDTAGCGAAGLNTGTVAFTTPYDAACCKP